MPTVKTEPSVVRGFRLPAQTLAKLDALAQQTARTRASMLIYLVTIAELTHFPDIRLRTEQPSPTDAA
jgi:predicted DNA-binding protein